jgi:hypothetical protein
MLPSLERSVRRYFERSSTHMFGFPAAILTCDFLPDSGT